MKKEIDYSTLTASELELRVRNHLLTRFAFTLVIIYFFDRFLEWISNSFLYPFVAKLFSINQAAIFSSSPAAIFQIILVILLRPLPLQIEEVILSAYSYLFSSTSINLINVPDQVATRGSWAVFGYNILFILTVLLLFAISLIPYLIGGIWFFFVIRSQITSLRKYDAAKRERSEQERNLMLADLAHDIKTPITTVVGYTKALSDGLVEPDKSSEYLHTINSKAIRISELVNLLFEYIKLDSAGYELSLNRIDFGELSLECLAEYYTDFEEVGLELDVDLPEVPMPILADRAQLKRVIHNLLANDIKYLETGNTVTVRMELPSFSNRFYSLRISDNGSAIDDDLAEHIFEPFSRGDKTRSTKGGSGLGLSIAYKIVALHGGRLLLDDTVTGQITKSFVISIPILPQK